MKSRNFCGQLRKTDIGVKVTLAGWVHRFRDHGGLIFIDLRDGSGIVQVVFDESFNADLFRQAAALRAEFVIKVVGTVFERSKEALNPDLPTGEIEVKAEKLEILNISKTPVISISEMNDEKKIDEFTRLKYRYLDLRKPQNRLNLVARHRIVKLVRDFLDQEGFLEIETPFLTKSTPEGARDYLVPSRVNPGKFYALPQSPQLFKQILMVAGLEKYFQIVRCFRDEDLRADRQPEFTQIDLELSFVEPDDIINVIEKMLAALFEGLKKESWFEPAKWPIKIPFKKMSYNEALTKYGNDKPDVRFGLELCELTNELKNVEFKVFKDTVTSGGIIKALKINGAENFSRSVLDELTNFVKGFKAKGLAWIIYKEIGGQLEPTSPIVKFFKPEELKIIEEKLKIESGEVVFFVADKPAVVNQALSELRLELGQRFKLIPEDKHEFLWVVDFPLFEFSQTENRWVCLHHPFTSPDREVEVDEKNIGAIKSKAYDLVLDGVELGGGSIRIHQRQIQEKIFEILGISEAEAEARFGFLLRALDFGAPPHGGIALGLDRLVMMLRAAKSLREVIAFPKTQSALCPLTDAPSLVDSQQLEELNIQINLTETEE